MYRRTAPQRGGRRGARRAARRHRGRRPDRPPRPGPGVTPVANLPDGPGLAPAVVAFGGGHGLAASLAALRRITDRLTAVVTVGDDGGSSGRLRAELGAL
ncbi:2-phospho-L-lactate transferase CofD family protein, partial [Frankia nepalensis]|uniref:2-phospho-L-lactate transferase CofD family protein n=1 Tax=Frankia nepalensis TaxID=1836974 RepID=UPI00396A9655